MRGRCTCRAAGSSSRTPWRGAGWSWRGAGGWEWGAAAGVCRYCLLQRGAAGVVAVDVGYGVLGYGLRIDRRVSVMERTNARALTSEMLPSPPVGHGALPDLCTIDVSFISLEKVLGAVLRSE